MSVEEYLEMEKDGQVRHEYVGGVAYAMTGGSGRHNRISGKIYRRLSDIAEGGSCRVYYYVEEPCLIIEVLSPNTESIDRREKLEAYKRIPTLHAYLMASQDERKVERYWRDERSQWWHAEVAGEGTISLLCPPEAELTLADVYEGL